MLEIQDPEVKGGKVSFNLKVPKHLKPIFKENTFRLEYKDSVEECPDSILAIPPTTTIAPIAWASNTILSTPPLDESFVRSLSNIQTGFEKLYPTVFNAEHSTINCRNTVANQHSHTSGKSVLYSGGVDSTAAVLDILKEEPTLLTVYGSDINPNNDKAWENVTELVEEFSEQYSLEYKLIKSNFRSMLRYRFLNHRYSEELNRNWWPAIQFGIAIPGVCAPIAYNNGYTEILQGSGYTKDPQFPMAAQPSIANELKWSGCRSRIVDVDKNRQEKIERISNHIMNQEVDPIDIRSCYRSDNGRNCSSCMKCRRTILGFILENIDPNEIGYAVSEETLYGLQEDLKTGTEHLQGVEIEFWKNLQSTIDQKSNYMYDNCGFFEWLDDSNINEFEGSSKEPFVVRTADRIIKIAPYPVNAILHDCIKPMRKILYR